jgi:hypothetical protein
MSLKILSSKNEIFKKGNSKQLNLIPSYPVFYLNLENDSHFIKLDSELPKDLIINFLPISLETFTCNVILLNDKIGEFMYSIEGTGDIPYIYKTFTYEDQ